MKPTSILTTLLFVVVQLLTFASAAPYSPTLVSRGGESNIKRQDLYIIVSEKGPRSLYLSDGQSESALDKSNMNGWHYTFGKAERDCTVGPLQRVPLPESYTSYKAGTVTARALDLYSYVHQIAREVRRGLTRIPLTSTSQRWLGKILEQLVSGKTLKREDVQRALEQIKKKE